MSQLFANFVDAGTEHGPGHIQSFRVAFTGTGGSPQQVNVSLPVAFADTAYTVSCLLEELTGNAASIDAIISKTASGFSVLVAGTVGSQSCVLHVIAVHD